MQGLKWNAFLMETVSTGVEFSLEVLTEKLKPEVAEKLQFE